MVNDGLLLFTVVVGFNDIRIGVLFAKAFGDRIMVVVVVVIVNDVVDVHCISAALFLIRKCESLSFFADDDLADCGVDCGCIEPLDMFVCDEFCLTIIEEDDEGR